MPALSVAREKRRFRAACAAAALSCLALAVLLAAVPEDSRAELSVAAMVAAGLVAVASGARGAWLSEGGRRVSLLLLSLAGGLAVAGNAFALANDADPLHDPSVFTQLAIAAAMILAILAVTSFPVLKPRGAELVLMTLDGFIVAGSLMIMTYSLVYEPVLQSAETPTGAKVTTLLLPMLDVALVSVSLMLITRSREDSAVLLLIGAGFGLYALADLGYASLMAHDSQFAFGGVTDLGWTAGYLLLALAAWHPSAPGNRRLGARPGTPGMPSSPDIRYTVLVFALLAAAVLVTLLQSHETQDTRAILAVLVVLLVCAAGIRQVLLAWDNAGLRRGLERRVREQTVDLRRMARQTEVLVTSVGDGIYGVDWDGRITFLNPSGARALGVDVGTLLGKRAHQEFHGPQEDGSPYPWTGCYVTEAIRHGVVASAEEDVYVRADGSSFPVEITSSPIVDDDRVTGAVVVFRDVTQRRELDRMKNEFLSVVSHELRTPLTSIRGALGLLAGGAAGVLPVSAQRMTAIALESTERLTRLINDILDIERLEAGTLPLRVSTYPADELLESAASELHELARSAGVHLVVGSAEGCVLADRDRVIQTLANLVGNAVKFSPAGGEVLMDARRVGASVQLRVRDTGRGIPSDKLESVFDRFEQVDSSDARLEGGTGLGLAISRGIVESLGGRIWAESDLGVGTTMYVSLPAAPSAAPSAAQAMSA